MKTNLKNLVGIASIVLLSGCSAYQHVRLASNTPMNEKSNFLIENDSINIIYSFNGQSGPINMELLNKLDKPIYIDWRKSALIINGQSFSLWKDEARISGTTTGYRIIHESNIAYSTGNLEGTIARADKVTFVPPHSKIVVNSYVLQTTFFNNPMLIGEKMKFYTPEGKRKAMKFTFSKEASPLNFRIFLSLSMDDSLKKIFNFDNAFWVSDYFNTATSAKALGIFPGNQFYNVK